MSEQTTTSTEVKPQLRDYLQSLYKLVPTEVSAAYLVIYSILDPLAAPNDSAQVWLVGMLFVAIVVLLLVNYVFFPAIRRIDNRDVRIFTSVTFIVWVIGTSVDLWGALLGQVGLNVPNQIFLAIVVLWAVGATAFLSRINIRVLDA